MEEIIRSYFMCGLNFSEILICLSNNDGIAISMRTLKRILQRLGLFRRKNYSDIVDVSLFLLEQIQTSGRQHGYKMMHLKSIQNGYVVTQETIREHLHILDPVGIKNRQRHRLSRRMYSNFGPNYLWHIDGYDKLKPFGICIHGAIDGFSRYILWLEAYTTNNDPRVISGYYIGTVECLKGCPFRIRADMGTENGYVRDMQILLRSLGTDGNDSKYYIAGSSNRNQRIERWWGILRTQNVQYWIEFFTMLENMGSFTGNFLDKSLIQFCFMDLIQEDLNTVRQLWNNHRIRRIKNQCSPNGRPAFMYTCPELYGTQNYLRPVDRVNIALCAEECVRKDKYCCDETVYEICTMIIEDHGLTMPRSAEDAAVLYQVLRREILEELALQ